MAGTYAIGEVPSQTVWSGETLSFKLTTTLGKNARFQKRAIPRPNGDMSIDEVTGEFKFKPAPDDKDEIAVYFTARAGAKEEKQKITVTPLPRLPSEFKVITLAAVPPQPANREYTRSSEEDAGKAVFNNVADYKDPKDVETMTKKVTISGVTVILEKGNSAQPFYDSYNGRKDIKELYVCADEVIIRSPLQLPGTTVFIHARSLRFEASGSLDTTPLSIGMISSGDEGWKGAAAGDIYLYVKEIDTPGNAVRLIAQGAKGQKARAGEQGGKGQSHPAWDCKASVGGKEVNWTTFLNRHPDREYKPIRAEVWRKTKSSIGTRVIESGGHAFNVGPDSWPGDGPPPKVNPGAPGHGGDGGDVYSSFAQALANRVRLNAGPAGERAEDIKPSERGDPPKSSRVRVDYLQIIIKTSTGAPAPTELAYLEKHESKPGPTVQAPGPNPKKAAGKDGSLRPLARGKENLWVHPFTVRAVINYVRDLFLANATDRARQVAEQYLAAIEQLNTALIDDSVDWLALKSELAGLASRINSPYDYFGNPAGWTPMLSFQANLSLYQREIKDAIPLLYLNYWIEQNHDKQIDAKATLEKTIQRLEQEVDGSMAEFESGQKQLVEIEAESENIQDQIKGLQSELDGLEKKLKEKAAANKQAEFFWRATGKLLGGIMQLIPAGQPALGLVGKGITQLSEIDLSAPGPALAKTAGVFAEVAAQKLSKKAGDLFSSTKEAKEKTKTEFEKAVAKSKLSEKVKKHLADEKAAKEQVLEVLGDFSAPADEIEAELERIKAENAEYQQIVAKIAALGKQKTAFAKRLVAVMQAMDDAYDVILNNQVAAIEMRSQLTVTINRLNHEALQHIQAIARNARDRLVKYQYYMVTSYQYLMADQAPAFDYRAGYMFDAFKKIVAPADGWLTAEQFSILAGEFASQLKGMTDQIIGWYQKHPPGELSELQVSLSPRHLEILNSAARKVTINLLDMGYLYLSDEDIRITDIRAIEGSLVDPPKNRAPNVKLVFKHSGESIIRRAGRLYLFRAGDYSAGDGEDGKGVQGGDQMSWTTTITPAKLTASEIDPAEESLLRYLLGLDKRQPVPAPLHYRPSAWADITIERSVTPLDWAGRVDNVVLKVSYVSRQISSGLSTLFVRATGGLVPVIHCSAQDLNDRGDGAGSFLRTYDTRKAQRVTLTAPAVFGSLDFIGWRQTDRPEPNPDEPVEGFPILAPGTANQIEKPEELIRKRKITVDITAHRMVTPVYAQLAVRPSIEDAGWPACQSNWESDEWVLSNESERTITISKLDYVPWRGKGEPRVNTAQGNNQIKLAFERVVLLPGDNMRFSVCTNPAEPGSSEDRIEFEFENYGVFFNGKGELSGLREWNGNWVDARQSFQVDKKNGAIIFRPRPR